MTSQPVCEEGAERRPLSFLKSHKSLCVAREQAPSPQIYCQALNNAL